MKGLRHSIMAFVTGMLITSCTCSVNHSSEQKTIVKKLIFEDDFSLPLDTKIWKIEMDSLPNSSVSSFDGKLVLDTKGGVTVWLDRKLAGDIEIHYKRQVVMADGPNDRLSDLNQFWMATDPKDSNLFTRSGKFEEYDSLRMYYVGFGGNYNGTTRFRKYQGNGEKTLLFDLEDEAYLLQPNHWYDISIKVENGTITYWVDGEKFFEYKDEAPLTTGYFGFRSTWSHDEIDSLRIYQLQMPENKN
ncbi:methyltransferase [Echinicola sp. CAU 1574]|uniref:Methyltransferase n=1 Tax=Echinicola arenosa TaxID=2774144 RepID=A0ABR9AQA8_9BACT|nr:DUF6250 domain-containing protein [Echinicola arenosa]MBD8489784.1 methyltransferase [Echinicola arenosa]